MWVWRPPPTANGSASSATVHAGAQLCILCVATTLHNVDLGATIPTRYQRVGYSPCREGAKKLRCNMFLTRCNVTCFETRSSAGCFGGIEAKLLKVHVKSSEASATTCEGSRRGERLELLRTPGTVRGRLVAEYSQASSCQRRQRPGSAGRPTKGATSTRRPRSSSISM